MPYNSIFLDSIDSIKPDWKDFLSSNVISLLNDIEEKIVKENSECTPKTSNVLNFLKIPLANTKVVILGQDPYPQKGVATGRAFEVGTLQSWNNKFSNISLKNIIRSIYFAYNNQYLKFSEIKDKTGKTFSIKPPDKLFVEWEKQGVLLLNTSFTCEIGKSNSHQKYWNAFTNLLLKYISKTNPDIIWFLWGNNAKSIMSDINIKNKIESMHPMMCYDRPERPEDFLFGKRNAFKETMHIINWLG
ncbi:MAG: uracil-DNA glycosylase [Bacteroidales bacterium]|jgi:uracil-DNA glycosylase|nr:uracil-DNA glycosylase [Bacteroidales bacterium]